MTETTAPQRRLDLVRYCKERGWFGVPLDIVMRADADLDDVEKFLHQLDEKTGEQDRAAQEERHADRDKALTERGLPTWQERTDGWQQRDDLDRLVRVRVSEFHGPMLSIEGAGHAYLGWDGWDSLTEHLEARRPPR